LKEKEQIGPEFMAWFSLFILTGLEIKIKMQKLKFKNILFFMQYFLQDA